MKFEKIRVRFFEFFDSASSFVLKNIIPTFVLLGGVFSFIYAIVRGNTPISPIELRCFVVFSLILFSVLVFGVLRLFNATVHNSRFLLQNKQEITKLSQTNNSLEQVLRDTKHTNTNLAHSTDKQRITTSDLLHEIRNFTDTIKQWKNSL